MVVVSISMCGCADCEQAFVLTAVDYTLTNQWGPIQNERKAGLQCSCLARKNIGVEHPEQCP